MSDIESHPEIRLKSRREGLQQEEVSTRQKWSEEWATSDVTNHSLVVHPSIAPPGFDLRRRLWSTLNHFRTGQGRCAANLVRWNQTSHPSCSCGASLQTMLHIVNDCRLSRYEIPRGSVSLASGWGGRYRLAQHAEHTL